MVKMSLKMKIIARGKRTVGVARYLKAKIPSRVCRSGPSSGERDAFETRITAKGKCAKPKHSGEREACWLTEKTSLLC